MKKKKIYLVILIIVLIIGTLGCCWYFKDKSPKENKSKKEAIVYDVDKMTKMFENDNYIKYIDERKKYDYGYEVIIFDKKSNSYINDLYNKDDKIYYFNKINDEYYYFIYTNDDYNKIYKANNNELVREIEFGYYYEMYNEQLDNTCYYFDSEFLGIKKAWNLELENNEYYRNHLGQRVNSDNTISVYQDKTVAILNQKGQTIRTKDYNKIIGLCNDSIVVLENNQINKYDTYFNYISNLVDNTYGNNDFKILEGQACILQGNVNNEEISIGIDQ